MPCNLNQRELAQDVKRGIREAGGTPIEFNTIAVSDGVSMGTEGMRASLVSREVIADSIELVARGHLFDGLVCLVGCDKTIPAAVMALARLDLPGLVLYNGSIAPGRFRGRDVTIQDVFEAVGAHAAGTMSAADVHELESVACPGAGACGGQFTANTMALALEFLGISPAGLNAIPAARSGEGARPPSRRAARRSTSSATTSGPSRILTRDGARERDRGGRGDGRLDERRAAPARDRPRARHPTRARGLRRDRRADARDRRPQAGRTLRRRPTCTRRAASRSSRASSSWAASSTATRRTSTAARSARSPPPRTRRPGQRVVVPVERPLKPTRRPRDPARQPCARGLRREARRATSGCVHRGPARVFDSEEDCFAAVTARSISARRRRRDPLRGPGGRARDAGDAARDRGTRRRRARRQRRARHGRPLLGRDAGFMVGHVSPEAARGGPLAAVAGRRHRRGRRGGA